MLESRPTLYGLERHLVSMLKAVRDFRPSAVVVDPITNFLVSGESEEVKAMLMRMVDFFKLHQVTPLFTSLTHGDVLDQTEVGISSLMDTWILLREIEVSSERNRTLAILKSRGMAHSNQLREMRLTNEGIELVDVYLGPGGALTGVARLAQETQEKAAALLRTQEVERRQRELERKREMMEARVRALQLEFATEEEEARQAIEQARSREERLLRDRNDMARMRRKERADIAERSGGA